MRLAAAVAVAAAVGLLTAGAAPTVDVTPGACVGLTICVPVGGPWVVVPARQPGAATSTASWQLTCPQGVVGGLDASLANTWIALSFAGRVGSPVNPGITTRKSLVFDAVGVGPVGAASTFLPVIGCMPGQGGQRTPTARDRAAPYRPGEPITRQVEILGVRVGRLAHGEYVCRAGQRLLSFEVTTGLYTAAPPTAREIASVKVTRSVRNGRLVVSASRRGLSALTAVDVQIHMLCARVVR